MPTAPRNRTANIVNNTGTTWLKLLKIHHNWATNTPYPNFLFFGQPVELNYGTNEEYVKCLKFSYLQLNYYEKMIFILETENLFSSSVLNSLNLTRTFINLTWNKEPNRLLVSDILTDKQILLWTFYCFK